MKKNHLTLLSFFLFAFCNQSTAQTDAPGASTTISVSGCGYNLNVSDAVCSGSDYTFPDGTTESNVTAQVTHTSSLHTVVNNCDSIINTTVNPLPIYNRTETFFSICSGDVYTFPDGSVQTIAGHTEYTSHLQTVGFLCDSNILTILNTSDINPNVTVSGNVITAAQGNAGYEWVDCNNGFSIISGQGGQSYTAPPGSFAIIIHKGGCTDTSACQVIQPVGIKDVDGNAVYLYPNPTNGMFKIDLGTTYSEVTVSVRNVVGQQLQTRILNNVRTFDTEIKATEGIYLIELHGSNGLNAIYRIMKQ